MYSFENVKQLQIELTTYCNAKCACCARNVGGGPLINRFVQEHMRLDTWYKIASKENLENVELLVFNGNYGDPLMHPLILDFLTYITHTAPHLCISIHTNGAIRDKNFWMKMAEVLSKVKSHIIHFGIDGIGKTHWEYRRVEYDKVIENAKSFIDAGGVADWRFIVFDHNKHQIKEANQTAKKLGFSAFSLNRSVKEKFFRAEGTDQDNYTITNEYTAPSRHEVLELIKEYNYGPALPKHWIDAPCPWLAKGTMQIDMFGSLWPCCYFSLDIFGNMARREYLKDLKPFNDLNKKTLKEVLGNQYWSKTLPKKWKGKKYSRCNSCQGNTNV